MTNEKRIYSEWKGLTARVFILALLLCSTGTALAQWTDPNTGVTFTPISGTDGFNANEGWASGCDGNVATKYCANEGNRTGNPLHWELVVQASQAVKLTGYTITTGNDDATQQNRRPYNWQIQGSNDNTNWTTIATVTNDNVIQPVNQTEYSFTCTTGNAYTYFRFYITAIHGGNIVQYSEFHPIGVIEPTGISVINKSIEIDEGATSLAYTLTPMGAYDRVVATSSNTDIFTVSSPNTTGSVTITPVAAGTATLTLTAFESDNTIVAATATATITVFVRPEADPTAITAKNMMASTGSSTLYTGYTLAVANPVTNKPHNFVRATSGNTAVATITNNADGTFTINAIADGTATITINAYGLDNTTVAATTTFTVTVSQASGVSAGGIVTLNDLEDHNWSYYQPINETYDKYPTRICSPYPRNVKITYYGYGTNTLSTSTVADPAANTFTTSTNANQVKVGIGEDGHTFVYYKTLERDANNRFPYELIPNPFYVRPSYDAPTRDIVLTTTGNGTGRGTLTVTYTNASGTETTVTVNINSNNFNNTQTITAKVGESIRYSLTRTAGTVRSSAQYDGGENIWNVNRNGNGTSTNQFNVVSETVYSGFYKWRVKSVTGGSIYAASTGGAALAAGSMLDAMTTYYFQPTDNASTNADNALSMQVELEALWAPAEIYNNGFSKGYNSVERNFRILTGNNGSLDDVKSNQPCTYTSFYPNGTTNGTTAATLANRATRTATFTATADSKIEYMLLNGNDYNVNAAAHSLTMGRGISPTGGTYSTRTYYPVTGTNNNALNFRTRFESGVYYHTFMMGENNEVKINNRVQHHFTFGSDYDRAKGDDSKLDVDQENHYSAMSTKTSPRSPAW